MSDETQPAGRAPHCPNCGFDLGSCPQARFCPECGQETHLHPPTLWEFIHEFITHYVALEGVLWRSLRALAVPGRSRLIKAERAARQGFGLAEAAEGDTALTLGNWALHRDDSDRYHARITEIGRAHV
mgnify:CR=1 FL=1